MNKIKYTTINTNDDVKIFLTKGDGKYTSRKEYKFKMEWDKLSGN